MGWVVAGSKTDPPYKIFHLIELSGLERIHIMNEVSGISEIVLVVKDVAISAKFYREIVGLAPRTKESKDWAWFWVGEASRRQMLGLRKGKLLYEEQSPLPPGRRWGPIHFAMRVERRLLDTALQRVRSNGVEILGPQKFRWMNAISYYFYDPDANLVEFWSPEQGAED